MYFHFICSSQYIHSVKYMRLVYKNFYQLKIIKKGLDTFYKFVKEYIIYIKII
jgi:hypothetical protein